MTNETIILTLVSSVISGVLGVVISSIFYSRLEKRRIKLETARKMFGNKHAMSGKEFQESINEVMIVFSDSQEVIDLVQKLFDVVSTPQDARAPKAADEALIKLMKAICRSIGIKHKNLPDTYYLNFFTVPSNP
ncbi:DUF6680 family protein [Idiomarina ramblicola]|uniref:DUF6680 domain-containing protein n=1 Tax=Idiomarina ramblicola TaxID=263724 RepID=A0A432Z5Y3_9GAMM|nr:DUF6680 family protein [Idiomarina ramblicola]RUO73297.1 hypothetical protein CWI78_02285 [Idiomarina ramblicola]